MNKKAEGAGGAIIFGIILALVIFCANNYWQQEAAEQIFNGCENFCINNSQEYYGVDNFKESSRTCICSNQTYPIYRKGIEEMVILDNMGFKTKNDALVSQEVVGGKNNE